MKMIKRKMTEEHKRKIGESNKIALKKFHEENPNYKNSGMFQKGIKHKPKTKEQIQKISGENSHLWKGGVSRIFAKKECIKHGKDLNSCQICKDELIKPVIHHINGDNKDNQIRNLGIVCYFCHNAIHDTPKRKSTRFQVGHLLNNHVRSN